MVKGWNKHTMVKASISIIYCRYIYSHCDMEEEDKRFRGVPVCDTMCHELFTSDNTNYTCMRARPRVATAAAAGGGGAVQCNATRPPRHSSTAMDVTPRNACVLLRWKLALHHHP